MADIKLSFCIPTYNRADYIGQTLRSIATQIIEIGCADCIEICISDNASTDATDAVIQDFKADHPSVRLVLSKNSTNLGADRNYLRVVELASGEYCWLFGSDDTLVPGAICDMLQELQRNYDIILSNRIMCDMNLNRLRNQQWLDSKSGSFVYRFSDTKEIKRYLENARSLGALFSYLSSIIVRRNAWNDVRLDETFIGTAYVHVHILLSIVLSGSILKYHLEPTVLCRGGNDSFATEGIAKRYLIDLDGYQMLADHFFYGNSVRAAFKAVLRREHKWYFFVGVANKVKKQGKWDELAYKLRSFGYHPAMLYIVGKLGASKFVMSLARYFRHKLLGVTPTKPNTKGIDL